MFLFSFLLFIILSNYSLFILNHFIWLILNLFLVVFDLLRLFFLQDIFLLCLIFFDLFIFLHLFLLLRLLNLFLNILILFFCRFFAFRAFILKYWRYKCIVILVTFKFDFIPRFLNSFFPCFHLIFAFLIQVSMKIWWSFGCRLVYFRLKCTTSILSTDLTLLGFCFL